MEKKNNFKKHHNITYKNSNTINSSTQNKFISQKYKNKEIVNIKTVNDIYTGEMLEFDSFTLLIKEVETGTKVLIFKNNIISIC
jgi:hypothetical protein